ncbi:outer membrane beta-barrel protein [Shewanella sp. KX20019]|uniref:outer membrane beta-barrel protein n=1 Tax=Shewanella sp. KX20019 TaxID=2803864 RepID=UPI00192966AD|nr:outer membrane beta-barrel protein [Shewanella sp. KX20019]QQX80214.1 outer membrane beta-barrel protein [Shewanella sp. KX20019]
MTKYLLTCFITLCSFNALANDYSQDEPILPKATIGITLDYIPAIDDLYGVTITPSHHDTDYANWGYYIGYAQSKKDDYPIEEPGEAYTKSSLWRFGLSYPIAAGLSFYGGAAAYSHELSSTNNITPLIVGGEPVWETEKETTWGAEAGLRYVLGENFTLAAGYNSATESAVFSIGYTM